MNRNQSIELIVNGQLCYYLLWHPTIVCFLETILLSKAAAAHSSSCSCSCCLLLLAAAMSSLLLSEESSLRPLMLKGEKAFVHSLSGRPFCRSGIFHVCLFSSVIFFSSEYYYRISLLCCESRD
eukprot:GHVU01073352.1.p2 GENE.GHVU01073352.1~~GHVU01073352.1.p2  ORF type:complete len:124 (+),score=10.71 GHVU01073352.1:82-453(+)